MRVAERHVNLEIFLEPRPSMGPQHESCGKGEMLDWMRRTAALQWGRNMRVAERMRRLSPS